MNRSSLLVVLAAGAAGVPSLSHAYVIEYRLVERVGDTDHVIENNRVTVGINSSHRYRIEFRVVPDGPDDALGGFFGWNVGRIMTTGGINTRTAAPPDPNPRGRVAPFNFPLTGEGAPIADPFTQLEGIDAVTTLFYGFEWNCGPDGEQLPMPEPTPVGRGEFVPVYDITSVAGVSDYTITFDGFAVVGRGWTVISCVPPDCGDPADPKDDKPGICHRAASAYLPTTPFSTTLSINVCPAEWNDDGIINSADVFAYFPDFFAGNADVNADGITNTADYFEFIISFLTNCR